MKNYCNKKPAEGQQQPTPTGEKGVGFAVQFT